MFNWMLDADWRTCGTQARGEISSKCSPTARAPQLSWESADLLNGGVVSAFHDVSASPYSHALTLAYIVTAAPRVGARNSTTLLRPSRSSDSSCNNVKSNTPKLGERQGITLLLILATRCEQRNFDNPYSPILAGAPLRTRLLSERVSSRNPKEIGTPIKTRSQSM